MEDKSIIISYETLFELLRIERSRTELQELPASYVEDIKSFIADMVRDINFTNDESEKKKKEILLKSTLKIANELYERREKKIVNLALDKSKTKSALIDFSKFLVYEGEMFQQILSLLDKYREEQSVYSPKDKGNGEIGTLKQAENNVIEHQDNAAVSDNLSSVDRKEELSEAAVKNESASPVLENSFPDGKTVPGLQKSDAVRHVRFLSPFPRFLGPELEEYGPFDEEEMVSLPSKVAELLVEKGRAEEILIKD